MNALRQMAGIFLVCVLACAFAIVASRLGLSAAGAVFLLAVFAFLFVDLRLVLHLFLAACVGLAAGWYFS